MTKLEENVEGGETAMLHLDDWEYCDELFNDPKKNRILLGSQEVKILTIK